MASPQPVVHMIGNAHIDPVWMWPLSEGRDEVLRTYRAAIERMEETPGFIFTSGGAVTYRWVQEDDPELFAAIRQRVAEGRWSLVNGWWLQPDCNIPCGESFVRHGLYGQRALEEMFGRRAVTGYNVDSFGHAGSLPQILLGCGLRNYVFFRPEPGTEKDLPATLFWWESDDGSRVLTSRPPLHYPSHGGDLIERIDAAAAQAPADVGHVMCFYGVGNHGGGPTRANLSSILQAMARPDGPEVRFGSTDAFFDAVRQAGVTLPVLHDDLQHHSRGCYTVLSAVKAANRQCENALLTAEKFAALAHRYLRLGYPHQALTQAWQTVLQNQFHDILAGTSIRQAYDEVLDGYAESEAIADLACEAALTAIADQVDTRGAERALSPDWGRALLVFNPLPWPQSAPVEAAVIPTRQWHEDWHGKFRPGVVHLADDRGQAVPCQVTEIEHDGAYYVLHFTFQADLPALGYRCYQLSIPQDAPTWLPAEPQAAMALENEHLALRFDAQTGWLTSLFDKDQGLELLRAAGGVPLVIDDPSDTWSHDVVSFDREIGAFDAAPEIPGTAAGAVTVVENGPVRQVVRACMTWGYSALTLDYILYAGDRQVYLDVSIDWHEQHKMLKLAFPLALDHPQSTASIPYGRIQRTDDGGEEPCQSWVDVSGMNGGRSCGLALLNDSKYGYDVLNGEMRLSLLRSPVYAFHRPRQIEPGVTYHYTDQGEHTVHLALVPHAGTYVEGDVVRRAESLNAPPIVREVDVHPGEWPAAASFVECASPNIVLTVVKLAEEGDDLIVRGYETAGQETLAEIRLGLDSVRWTATWKPHQMRTWRLKGAEPVEVNLMEE